MKKLLLLVSAVAMAGLYPANAKNPGKSQGHKAHTANHAGKASTEGHAKANGKAINSKSIKSTRVLRDRDRDGIDDRDEALARKYGGALCPPGLAKKTPACTPPGQARRVFREGQRVVPNYRYTPLEDIPLALRQRLNLTDDNRYIYRDNIIYVVDPQTRLVRSTLDAVL